MIVVFFFVVCVLFFIMYTPCVLVCFPLCLCSAGHILLLGIVSAKKEPNACFFQDFKFFGILEV